jgi:hypothetical protein
MSRRQRLLIQVAAHLVILAYIFQIGAFEHWHSDVPDMVGSAASDHAMHCHGNASGCSDSVDPQITATLEGYLLPAPPEARNTPVRFSEPVPDSAFIPGIDHPPRA